MDLHYGVLYRYSTPNLKITFIITKLFILKEGYSPFGACLKNVNKWGLHLVWKLFPVENPQGLEQFISTAKSFKYQSSK